MQQIAVRAMQFERVDAEPLGALAPPPRTHRECAPSRRHRARSGAASPSLCGTADGATVCQPPSASGICWPPSHGVWLDPLRPACASCIATAALECLRTEARIGFSAASVASFHSPRQPGVMRPIASTCVASMQNIAAPDSASVSIWVKCQSLAAPSIGRILAHRRHHDAVGQRETAQGDGRKQSAHAGMSGWEGSVGEFYSACRRGRSNLRSVSAGGGDASLSLWE